MMAFWNIVANIGTRLTALACRHTGTITTDKELTRIRASFLKLRDSARSMVQASAPIEEQVIRLHRYEESKGELLPDDVADLTEFRGARRNCQEYL